MEILHFEDLGDKSVVRECSLGVNLVIDNLDKIRGIQMSFSCERSCSSPRKVSNFNSNVPQGGIYLYIKFERDPLNIFPVRALTSSGSTERTQRRY